ncbi:MAG: hypothetical protein ABEJ42_08755 [Halobacteriaceae archaeon]
MSSHTYDVAFDVNGTVKQIECDQVKTGNDLLRCMMELANADTELVALVPLDTVEYIVHRDLAVQADEFLAGDAEAPSTAGDGER